jgi:putative sterol carrier protein
VRKTIVPKETQEKGIYIMTYNEIVNKAKEIMSDKTVPADMGHLAVQVNVTGEGEGIFYIEVADGKVNVEPYDYKDNDCTLITSADNLVKIVSGELDPVAAVTTGKLKVDGNAAKALELKKVIGSKKAEKAEKAEKAAPAKESAPAKSAPAAKHGKGKKK